jgi:hypothetical protein
LSSVLRLLVPVVPVVWILVLSALPGLAHAQGSQHDPARRAAVESTIAKGRSALAPIAGIVGQWEGDAHILVGEEGGGKMTVRQSEDISWGASQTVILIRGTGRSVEAANRGEIVFEAAAALWSDPASDNKLMMRTFHDGRSLAVDVEMRGDTLVWGFPAGPGRMRFAITVTDDTYHEIGEFIRPGAPPIKTIEITLRRK